MENNTEFFTQSGEIEKLKKERKKKTEIKDDSSELTIINADKADEITQELAKVNITEQVLKELTEYKKLTVNGIDDKDGYEKVKNAQTVCRNTRTLAVKICKHAREGAIAYQRACIKKEKEVSEQIEEVETYLKEQREIIDGEKARQVAERENFMKTRMQARTTTLLSFGAVFDGQTFTLQGGEERHVFDVLDVKMVEDPQFNMMSLKMEILHEKSKVRISQEQENARIEAERVAAIAAQQKEESERLAKQAADIKAAQDALDKQRRDMEIAEEKRLAVAKAEENARIQAEKDKQEALAQAEAKRLEDIARLEKAAADKVIADKKAEEERIALEKKVAQEKIDADNARIAAEARAHSLLPDKTKLEEFAGAIEAIQLPDVTSEEATKIVGTIKDSINKLAVWTRTQTSKLQ
jgi:hypothetical protein